MHLIDALVGPQQLELNKAALVDLDWSSAFMLVLFLLFWAILNKILIQPMLSVLDRRHQLTDGARNDANRAVTSAEAKIAEYEARVGEARRKAVAEQKLLRTEGQARDREVLAEVRAESEQQIAAGVLELQESANAIDNELQAHAQTLGQKIVGRIMGGGA
jgi:F-type H+-transporting ATPase subunit b